MPDLRALLRELAMWKEKRGRAILAKLFHFQPHFVLRHHVCHSSFGPITKPTNRLQPRVWISCPTFNSKGSTRSDLTRKSTEKWLHLIVIIPWLHPKF